MNWQKNSLFIVVIFINFLFSVHNLQAKMTVNHEKISVNYSIYKNLTLLKGQIISVELKSGKVYEGVVKSVSDNDLPPKKRTMTRMRFPIKLQRRRSQNEEKTIYRRTNNQSY